MSAPSPPPATPALRRSLLAFYDAHARDLPWRGTGDPYAIWVSEVMLQQTRVETVVPFYRRWMERFPDLDTLARAGEDEVMRAWEGLGYYRRARWLHRGAAAVHERFGGELPSDPELLRKIPGVGAYTAGAVASIAFGVPAPAVDGNVRRVLSRLFDLAQPGEAELRSLASDLVDPGRPGDFNQALMELGATLCTPRSPACGTCPVEAHCLARERGVQTERPAAKPRRTVPSLEVAVAIVARESPPPSGWEVAIVRRPAGGLLGGLWEFPGIVLDDPDPSRVGRERADPTRGAEAAEPSAACVLDAARRAFTAPGTAALAAADVRVLEPVRHVYSHLRATYRPVLFRLAGADDPGRGFPGLARPVAYPSTGGAPPPAREPDWVGPGALAGRALPRAQRRIVRQVREILEGSRPPGA